jgi:regulator of nonsense transcripts 1
MADPLLLPPEPAAEAAWSNEELDDASTVITDTDVASESAFGGDDDFDAADYEELAERPKHACAYCHASDPLCAVKCNQCKKWFCNNRSGNNGPSHIIAHLVRSKHNSASLHEEGPLGDSVLECYVCGTKNLFLLGFVPSKAEGVMVLLCREPCVNNHTLTDLDWDASLWQPLVEDRALLTWVAKLHGDVYQMRGKRGFRHLRDVSGKQIVSLEELWKTNPGGDLEDLRRSAAVAPLEQIPRAFDDADDYVSLFSPLLDAEAEESRQMKEKVEYTGLKADWEPGVKNSRYRVTFELPQDDQQLSAGDNLMVMHRLSGFEQPGTIIVLEPGPTSGLRIVIEMVGVTDPPADDGNFSLKLVFNPVTYERMRNALRTMASDETSLSAYLFHRLLGQTNVQPPPMKSAPVTDIAVPHLPRLNGSQAAAVRKVLGSHLSLIQGPPGTGKTVTSATLVYHMCKANEAQVLVCSPSNVAVDQLAERLQRSGLNVIRVAAKSREGVTTSVDHLTLHTQLTKFVEASPRHSELKKLMRLRQEVGTLSDRDRRRYRTLCTEAEQSLIAAADVVCCTCSVAGDKRLESYRFKYVLVDESTQAAEPECLIPLVHGAKQVVLVGDHCQMRPVIMCRRADAAGLARSLFERLVQLGEVPIRLDIQYRMHPCLSEFSSNAFYEGSLQNGVTPEERDSSQLFPWPNPQLPMLFYNSTSPEELSGTSTSFINRTEAAIAEKAVTLLIKNGVKPSSIGVVTPYEGQRAYLVNYMARNGALGAEPYRYVEVASVDSFQGREQEFIVLTCVRSNERQGIGFLSDWRRLNVALTRARQGLILIGNARVLARHALWHNLVSHFSRQSLVVDGPITALTPVKLTLPKSRAPDPMEADAPWFQRAADPDAADGVGDDDDDGDEVLPEVDFDYVPGQQSDFLGYDRGGAPQSQGTMSVGSAFSERP